MNIKVLGIGHSMRGDDEVGLIIIQRWIRDHGPTASETIEAEILESPGITLLSAIAGLDAAVLVDAVQSGAPVGSLHKLAEEDLAAFTEGSASAHGWGTAETLSLGRQLIPEEMPGMIYIIGVEAVKFELGEGLSPAVRAALPKAVKMVEDTLREIQRTNRWGRRLWRNVRQVLRLLPQSRHG
jgi:hydrogenase maturation protease